MIEALDPDQLRAEIDVLDRKASALRVLLRSAVARQRHRTSTPAQPKEARRAD
jgi:hypothetical protein